MYYVVSDTIRQEYPMFQTKDEAIMSALKMLHEAMSEYGFADLNYTPVLANVPGAYLDEIIHETLISREWLSSRKFLFAIIQDSPFYLDFLGREVDAPKNVYGAINTRGSLFLYPSDKTPKAIKAISKRLPAGWSLEALEYTP